ncbi:MAG: flagellin [Bryobacteraceae bacterium]|jgi:flagellin
MSFSINTNITSLQAQNYLQMTSTFQAQTINEVTSGLRIVNSGNDAAGLAVANSDRSNEAVLTQGIQNANNGLATLQTADGGLDNISQLLDRARTLATESASSTFTGDRGTLNSEFQSVLTEVNRQAQAIGLNSGGSLATNLSVFVGGGQTSHGVSAISNGSVSLNLTQSGVDAKSLGLEGVAATGAANTDIGAGSTTNVQTIVTNANNLNSIANNTTTFSFTGPGFANTSGSNTIQVAVNLTGVTDTGTLVTAINKAIQNAGNGNSQQATAFQNANITAAVNTDANSRSQLQFTSSNSAFQVQGDDQVATALLGSFSTAVGHTVGQGNIATAATAVTGTGSVAAFAAPAAAETAVKIRLTGDGLNGAPANDLSVNLATTDTITTALGKINAAIAANTTVAATGVTAVAGGASGNIIQFVGPTGSSFQVQTAGDVNNALGFGAWTSAAGQATTATTFNYNNITATAAFSTLTPGTTEGMDISINGGPTLVVGTQTTAATEAAQLSTLNTAFQANAATRAAGITATDNAGSIEVSSANNVNFRLSFYGGSGDALGFGAAGAGSTATSAASFGTTYAVKNSINSSGAEASVNGTNTDVYQFTGLQNFGDAQTITLSAVDGNGAEHSLNVNLTTANAGNLDQALGTINSAIAASNDSTLNQIAAFKEQGTTTATPVNGVEGIRFLSAGGAFTVSLGASNANGAGVDVGLADGVTGNSGGGVLTSALNGVGSTANINNVSTATAAVTQLANSVQILGSAQAVVGQGENEMNYAINLASSQLTNTAAAESNIRDANMATESANLTKASIQLQAGIAALAQANSAPQQILTLLQK